MKTLLLVILGFLLFFLLFFTWCCMKVSGEADRREYERTKRISKKR